MRKQLPIALVLALTISGGLYGLLNAVDPSTPVETEDPWLQAWRAAGLKGQFVAQSTEPEKNLGLSDARELTKGAAFRHSVLRRYIIQGVTLQVAVLPRAGLLPELPEGRHPGFRLKPKGNSTHLCRSGRNLLFVRTTQVSIIPLMDDPPTPKALAERIFDVFEKTAAVFP